LARLPIVSIVGRPNVGKSSLFNRIVGRRLAVVDDMPGVTRDRNYSEAVWQTHKFMIVDTGGLMPESKDSIPVAINVQVQAAIEESAAIIFLTDATTGPVDTDLIVARMLRKACPEKVIVAANKAESPSALTDVPEHIKLGLGDPIAVSAIHGQGIGDLLDGVLKIFKQSRARPQVHRNADLSLSIIGRPNAGKSSLVNKLLDDERMIVDDVAGTTRDAIDSYLEYEGKTIRIIDTAGLRKKSQVHDNVEYYSNLRALDSLNRADVCALMVDTSNRLGEQDFKILAQVLKARKGAILIFNKWDLIEKDHKTFDELVVDTRHNFVETRHIPILSMSALTGQRARTVLATALEIQERMSKRVPPAEMRDAFFSWLRAKPHPFQPGKEFRFLGLKQTGASHPHFVFFCVNPENVAPAYRRFLTNKFHDTWDFSGCPVTFEFRSMTRGKRGRSGGDNPEASFESGEFNE